MVFVSLRGWVASCLQAVLMVSFKSLQVPAKPSPLTLETILSLGNMPGVAPVIQKELWSPRAGECAEGRLCMEKKRAWNSSHSLPEVTVPAHVGFWLAFLPISVSLGSGTCSARYFPGSCAGGMCLLLAPLALCWALAVPGRSCFGIRLKNPGISLQASS